MVSIYIYDIKARNARGVSRRANFFCGSCNSAFDSLGLGLYVLEQRGSFLLHRRAFRTSLVIEVCETGLGRVLRAIAYQVIFEGQLELGLLQPVISVVQLSKSAKHME